jgi:hypothetical protein
MPGLLAVAAASLLIGCGSEDSDALVQGCTLSSCTSHVAVRADGLPQQARSVTFCKDSLCVTEQIPRSKTAETVSFRCSPQPATIRASVIVSGSGGRVVGRASRVVSVERNQPNGPDCPPTCWSRDLHYSGVRNDLRPHQF